MQKVKSALIVVEKSLVIGHKVMIAVGGSLISMKVISNARKAIKDGGY